MTPVRLHAFLARAEAVTWTLLLAGMVAKYVTATTELGVRVGGGLHGFVFLAYCLVTVLVAVDQRWGARRMFAGLACAVVPFATLPFERALRRDDAIGPRWRLRSEDPSTALERLVGAALRRPLPAVLVAAGVLGAVFSGLLVLGPPTQWAS